MRLRPIIALLLFSSTLPLFSQVSPEAPQGGWPIVIGGGFSDFATDYHGGNRMEGVTAWVDWNFYSAPGWLSGFGLEVKGHTIRFGVPSGFSQLREDNRGRRRHLHLAARSQLPSLRQASGRNGQYRFPSNRRPVRPDNLFA